MISFLLGLLAGVASPTQASVNSRMREDLRSPYTTSIYNFICATVIMAVAMLVIEKSLYIPVARIAEQPFWIWLGGTCGTFIVFLNIICLPKLGSARNVMLLCFGQTMTGLMIDHFGLFGSAQIPLDMKRVTGAVIVLAGIVLVNIPAGRDRANDTGDAKGGSLILYMILSMLCGFSCASQVAINGTLREYSGSAVRATFISMAVGLISIIILTLIVVMLKVDRLMLHFIHLEQEMVIKEIFLWLKEVIVRQVATVHTRKAMLPQRVVLRPMQKAILLQRAHLLRTRKVGILQRVIHLPMQKVPVLQRVEVIRTRKVTRQ